MSRDFHNELIEKIKAKKYFYRDHYHQMCNALWGAIILIILLSLLNVYVFIQRPLPDFYATSNNGGIAALTPMSAPNYSHTPLI